jgi:hypothetical protein
MVAIYMPVVECGYVPFFADVLKYYHIDPKYLDSIAMVTVITAHAFIRPKIP